MARVIPPSPFLLNVDGVHYRSTHLDQGWQVLNASGGNVFWDGTYIDDRLLFLGRQPMWRSLDGGRSLTEFSLPGSPFLSDIAHLGGNELLAFGWQPSVGHIRYYTADVGETWTAQALPSECGWNGEVTYVGHRTILANLADATCSDGRLAQSTDLGLTWTEIDPVLDGKALSAWWWADWDIDEIAWNQVEGPGSVLLASGRLYKYENDFDFINVQVYGLWKSVDSGKTWRHLTVITPDMDSDVSGGRIALDRQGNALVVGNGAQLYRSTDAGETWELATRPIADGYLGSPVYMRSHLPPPQRPQP